VNMAAPMERTGVDIRRCRNIFCLVIMLAGMLAPGADMVLVTAAYAEESMEIECYIKVDDDYAFVGNVDISDESKAADACNSAYTECRGQCAGCYLDEDDEEEYCYDNTGRKFEK